MNGGTPSEAAMSLWQKFSDLQSQAEEHRSRCVAAERQTADIRSDMERLREEMEIEEKRTVLLTEETEKYESSIDCHRVSNPGYADVHDVDDKVESTTIHSELARIDREYSLAADRISAAERALERLDHRKQEELIAAKEQSRSWQQDVHELRLQCLSVGLSHANMNAGFVAFGREDLIVDSEEPKPIEVDGNEDENENDPLSWSNLDGLALQVAVDSYKKRINERTELMAEKQTLQEKVDRTRSKYDRKKQRAISLREQIEQVNKERADLELQLSRRSAWRNANPACGNPYVPGK